MEKEQNHRQNVDEMQKAANEYKEKSYKYDAFISYRHVEPDQSIAKQVHQLIETFKAPKEFYQNGKRPVFRVFRDREELAARDLSASIEEALATSRYLIVICSKRTPLSEWCQREIETFKSLHGEERIIPVLIEGEPDEAFPLPLKEMKKDDGHEILAADIRPDDIFKTDFSGYENLQQSDKPKLKELTKKSLDILKTEKYRIMATVLGCSFGDLKQRDKERKNKRILTVSTLSGVVFLIFGLFMANAYQKAELARQEAVQSNASILMKRSKDFTKEGDFIKAVLVAKEAMKSIKPNMKYYDTLKAEENTIFNSMIYHSGASILTSISTKNKLTFMDISHDEKYVAYGFDNNNTAIASVVNGEVLKIFSGHTQAVKFVKFSKDDKYLASAAFDNTCIIYDVETGEEKVKLEVDGIPMMVEYSDDGSQLFYIVFNDNTTVFYVYDTNNWQKQGEFMIDEQIKSAYIKKDGSEVLITLNKDKENQLTRRRLIDGSVIDVIPREKGISIISQEEYEKEYISGKYSDDGENMLVISENTLTKISMDNQKIFIYDKFFNSNYKGVIAESKNGDKILIRSGSSIEILDGKRGDVIDKVYFEKMDIKNFEYNSDKNILVGFDENGNYSIWKDNVIVENNLSYGGGMPSEFKFLRDGSKIIANSHDNQTIKIIDLMPNVLTKQINGRILANSSDFSHMLLFDGNDILISGDHGITSKKIMLGEIKIYGVDLNNSSHKVSNNGRYYATIGYNEGSESKDAKLIVELYDMQNNISRQAIINKRLSLMCFTDDSKKLLLLNNKEGLNVYDTENLNLLKNYSEIKEDSGNMILSKDSKILVLNSYVGIAYVYNLDTGEHIEDIPGEVVYVENSNDEIKLKGIKNNYVFTWSSKNGLNSWELDEECNQTALSFNDVNLYNKKSDILMMIRNNNIDRKCYIVDFSTGKLKMTLNSAIKDKDINGHISYDGNIVVIDQYYDVDYNKENSTSSVYIGSTLYNILDEEEIKKEVDNILAGRVLTEDEKKQIGISTR